MLRTNRIRCYSDLTSSERVRVRNITRSPTHSGNNEKPPPEAHDEAPALNLDNTKAPHLHREGGVLSSFLGGYSAGVSSAGSSPGSSGSGSGVFFHVGASYE